MKIIKAIIFVILLTLALISMFQNYEVLAETISLRFDVWFMDLSTIPIPLGILFLCCFFIGFILASSVSLLERVQANRKIRELKRDNFELQRELSAVRGHESTETTKIEYPGDE